MRKAILLFLVAFLCTEISVLAQGNSFKPLEDFVVHRKHTGNKANKETPPPIEQDDVIYVVYAFKVKDWTGLTKFHLKLDGKTVDNKDKEKQVLEIDISNPHDNLPEGFRYTVKDNQVYITMGGHKDLKKYKGQV